MSLWKVPKFLLSRGSSILSRTSISAIPIHNSYSTNWTEVYEPDYLASMEPDIPIYESLNIQIKGYDYPILENYQKLIHKLAETLEIEVDECWGTPGQKLKIQKMKPLTAVVDSEYILSVYERNVQIIDVPSTSYTVLLRLIQESIPEGVSVQVHESEEEHQRIRYVPDNTLKALKVQLIDLGGPSKLAKKK